MLCVKPTIGSTNGNADICPNSARLTDEGPDFLPRSDSWVGFQWHMSQNGIINKNLSRIEGPWFGKYESPLV